MSLLKYLRLNKIKLIISILLVSFSLASAKPAFYIGYNIKEDIQLGNSKFEPLDRGFHKLYDFNFGYISKTYGKNKKMNYCIEFNPKIKYNDLELRLWSYLLKKSFTLNPKSDFFIKFGLSDVKMHINSLNTTIYFDRQYEYGFGIIFNQKIQFSYIVSKMKKKILPLKNYELTLARINLSYLFSK